MIFIRKPSRATVAAFLARQSTLELTYSAVSGTLTLPPAGFAIDRTRIRLGAGAEVFAAGRNALEHWQQFRLGWLEALPERTPIRTGEVVAVLAYSLGLWWLNACRIVAVIDEQDAVHRFGFAYGTLPDHAGRGEERFLVEWDRRDDSVWFDILAFSRPQHWLARLGYFWMRRVQKRFGRDAGAAMLNAVTQSPSFAPVPPRGDRGE